MNVVTLGEERLIDNPMLRKTDKYMMVLKGVRRSGGLIRMLGGHRCWILDHGICNITENEDKNNIDTGTTHPREAFMLSQLRGDKRGLV